MSVAASFGAFTPRFRRPTENEVATWGLVGGLTHGAAMDLYFNTENLVFAFNGADPGYIDDFDVPHTASMSGSIGFNPRTLTGDFRSFGYGSREPVDTPHFMVKPPRLRLTPSALLSSSRSGHSADATVTLGMTFAVRVDPDDTSRFAILYQLAARAAGLSGPDPAPGVYFAAPPYLGWRGVIGEYAHVSRYVERTFEIDGIEFPYRCYFAYGLSGRGITVTRSAFTYAG
jgi:hypothetical protein